MPSPTPFPHNLAERKAEIYRLALELGRHESNGKAETGTVCPFCATQGGPHYEDCAYAKLRLLVDDGAG